MDKISNVLGCKSMEGLVRQEEDFIFDTGLNWQPMMLHEDGSNVKTKFCV